MSDLIRMYGMKLSHNGTCRKCGVRRDKGNHSKCDRWPSGGFSSIAGFHYTANSKESNLDEFKKITDLIARGDDPETPVQFEIRVRQIIEKDKKK